MTLYQQQKPSSGAWPFAVALGAILAVSGCAIRVGPKTIARDRFDYAAAITGSWKQQMLMNMVRMRYFEPPMFLEIAQVISSYTFEASASVSATDWLGAQTGSLGGAEGRWSESPTITYNPLFGEKFTKDLLQPIPPAALLSLIQAGWPADAVLAVGARAINGLSAGSRLELMKRTGDPRFYQTLALLRQLQQGDAFGLRVEQKEGAAGAVVTLQRGQTDESMVAAGQTIRKLLRLDPEAQEFDLAFGSTSRNDKEIAIATRSMLEILGETSAGIEVPASHKSEGRVTSFDGAAGTAESMPKFIVRVRCTEQKPPAGEAFVAVNYRHHWFWVDDRDISSKRGMAFLMMMFTMVESGGVVTPPVFTISKP